MTGLEFLLGLLVVIAGLGGLAMRVGLPYPVFLFVGGIGLGAIPGAPDVRLEPDVIFLVFLPPLVYQAAFVSSPRELRANVRPIALLAVALVLVTLVAVGLAAHLVVGGLPLAAALALGAILAPTDPVAATAIIRRVGAPGRLVTLLEGEALINDGVGLAAYSVAVSATVGTIAAPEAVGRFVLIAGGGVAFGLAVGWVMERVRRRIDDPELEITVSLATAYLAYIPADELGVSGILAAVTTGLYLGSRSSGLFRPATRLQAAAFWGVLVFLLNGLLFLLLGLDFPQVLAGLDQPVGVLLVDAVVVAGAVIAVRLAWQFTVPGLVRLVNPRVRREEEPLPRRERVVLGWSGMRGAVSVAAALALPMQTEAGAPFPDRELLIYLTFAAITATLVLQGLTLPALIRALGVREEAAEQRALEARLRVAHAALARLQELASERDLPERVVERLRERYESRVHLLDAELSEDGDERSQALRVGGRAYQELRRELIAAEREAVLDLRRRREIQPQLMRALQRELDLEASRLEE